MRWTLILLLLAGCSVASAAPPPEKIQRILDRWQTTKDLAVKQMEAQREKVRLNRRIPGPQKRVRLGLIDKEIEAARDADFEMPRLPSKPSAGDIGVIDGIRVTQVLTKDSALVELQAYVKEAVGWGYRSVPAIIKSIDTTGWTDDAYIRGTGPVEITGTETYDTALGATRTVLTAKPFDLNELQPHLPKP